MTHQRRLPSVTGAFLAACTLSAAQAAPIVTASQGGAQSIAGSSTVISMDTVGPPSGMTGGSVRTSSAMDTLLTEKGASFSTGVMPVPTFPPFTTGATALPGLAAIARVEGVSAFQNQPPSTWSAGASAIASAQSGRIELQAQGVPYHWAYDFPTRTSESLLAFSSASGSIFSFFQPEFSREMAATLSAVPQYLTLTATLTGHTYAPGQAKGSLQVFSNYLDQSDRQVLNIDVQETGDWTKQYDMQFAFTSLANYGGFGNCLQRQDAWVECLSSAAVEAEFSLSSSATTDMTSTLSVLLSWSVPDTILELRTDAANWGSPLAVDLPPSAVPEPGSATMVLLGLGLLAGCRRVRRTAGSTPCRGRISAR